MNDLPPLWPFEPMIQIGEYTVWDTPGWKATRRLIRQATPTHLHPNNPAVVPLLLALSESVRISPPTDEITLRSVSAGGVTISAALVRNGATLTDSKDQGPRIARAPAGRLISVLRFVLTRAAYERIFAPYIAQEQHEHYEALLRKEFRRAGFIVARMYLGTIFIAARTFVAPFVALLATLFTRSN